MPVQIIDDSPPKKTVAEKIAPWVRRLLIGGLLLYVCFAVQTFSEDTRSHTIKISYPLLLNHETITAPQPGYDSQKAVWTPVKTAFPVRDGDILFVKCDENVYAVQMVHETIKPEQAEYAYLKVGSTDPVVKGSAQTDSGTVALPEHHVGWSGKSDGAGYLYLDESFIWAQPPRYTVGVPFQTGQLEDYRKAVPPGVHFESLPWKINEGSEVDLAP